MILATLMIALLGAVLGLLLGVAGKLLAVAEENPLVKQVEDMLPGSQCGQCGYPGCSPAAQALVGGDISVNFCPPGGKVLAEDLAKLFGIDPNSVGAVAEPLVATINESQCTGCTKCFKACPTDAVVGANGQIHVVMTAACTGCKKCYDACPEDCIAMQTQSTTLDTWHWSKPVAA